MIWLVYLVLGFLGIRLGIAALNVISRPFPASKGASHEQVSSVSILIPARNEEANLPKLLDQLLALPIQPLEIIVLNDQSDDQTEAILQQFSHDHEHIHYHNGTPLPAGWLGKNWACHQLAQHAKGDYLLYLDADVAFLHPDLIPRSLASAQQYGLSLTSIFPDQLMESRGERLVVPILHYLVLTLIPLWWIYRLPFPSMSAASGQYMLFEGKAYRTCQWHERVKDQIVDDNAIMQQIKEHGLKGMFFLAQGLIKCRMYHSLEEGINGFSKNMLAVFGNSVPGLLIYHLLIFWGWALLMTSHIWWSVIAIVAVLTIRIMISVLAKQAILPNLVAHPLQMGLLVYIGIRSIKRKFTGINEWKGRNVHLPQA